MQLKNKSNVAHRYAVPGSDQCYIWRPGETKIVPDSIGKIVLANHAAKFDAVEFLAGQTAGPRKDWPTVKEYVSYQLQRSTARISRAWQQCCQILMGTWRNVRRSERRRKIDVNPASQQVYGSSRGTRLHHRRGGTTDND